WHAENKDRPLDRARGDFAAVREQTLRRVRALTQADFERPEKLAWLEGAPLAQWIASDTFEHEAEHLQQIREWRSRRGV
ncbi:MAG: ClbS/DfsB family four-helix bundle protein, partial [Chloroflexi bacterium]|nr:ClbS/DfsB family four-helix bundle protein [Chloroflexota bacterium]